MKQSLVYVQNIDSFVLEQTLPPAPSLSWLQYWVANVSLVWRDNDLFSCPVCKHVHYKKDIVMAAVQITSARVAPKQYVPTHHIESLPIYIAPLCPICATRARVTFRINPLMLLEINHKK